MLIFILFVSLAAACFVASRLIFETKFVWGDEVSTFFLGSGLVMSIVVIGLLLWIFIAHVNPGAKVAELEAERSVLVYQLESETYLNDNNLGTVELMEQIGKFNSRIESRRLRRQSLWTNWLVSPAFDEVDPIPLGRK